MNATPPVSQIPIASDPAQQSSASPANSVKSGANGQDFAAALGNAGTKSIRKAAGHKPADADSVGGHLPAPGNLSPPPPPPPPIGSAAALAAATITGTLGVAATPGTGGGTAAGVAAGTPTGSAVVNAAGTPAGNAGITAASTVAVGTAPISGASTKIADPGPGSASAAPKVAPGAEGALPSGTSATPIGAGAAITGAPAGIAATASGAATAAAGSTPQTGAAAGTAATTGSVATTGAGADTGAGTAASTAMTRGAAGTAAAAGSIPHPDAAVRREAGASPSRGGKPLTGAAATAAVNAATSWRTGPTDSSAAPSTNTGAWTSTDPTAQAVTAAAMSAAATGAVAADAAFAGAADSPSTPTVDSATPAKGAAGPNGSPVPAPAISVARAAAAASAKAAAPAPGATTLADAGATDKRAPGGSGDALLSGTPGDGMTATAQLSAATNGVTDATPAPTLKVSAGVDTPEFGQGLADRVSWMVDNNLNGAKLQVNPPQLGPIEVRIAVQGNHAQVWLTSHSAVTRDALESSSPKLREMLGAQGFGQVSVDISQRSYQERSAFSQPYQGTPFASPRSSAAAVQSTASSLPRLSSGAVDAYA
jgi:flagellar hook-length control protein FliK